MKTQKKPSAPAAALPAKATPRAARRTHITVKPQANLSGGSRNPAALVEAAFTLPTANNTIPVLGSVRQDWAPLPAPILLVRVRNAKEGLTGNLFYEKLPEYILPGLRANEAALILAAENRAAAENLLKTARLAESIEMGNAVEGLRSAATACETIDRRDEALVSAGWGLRRTATRPKPVAAPGRLTLKNTAFAGEVEARWGRVGNAHYYEYQLAVTPSSPEPVLFDTLPILANGPTSCFFSGHPVGYYLTLRVRGNGSKGPSPWTETTTIRIN